MCGIAGFISASLKRDDLLVMTDRMRHRGPDGSGYFFEPAGKGHVGLGHRRLSIIDLSEASAQPMVSHCGRYTMIFNGEIYNFLQLRQTKCTGVNWRSSGDGEVILECFARYGKESFSWLNGMFAIAIWDKQENKLTLARDHVGIKPIYYYRSGKEILFASELKGITALKKGMPLRRDAITAFLHLGYIPHPLSVYEPVQKLGAGSWAEISYDADGSLLYTESAFWRIQDHIQKEVLKDETEAKKMLSDLLFDSVAGQLLSDVPIGTFLSGGTDSSIVTAIATKVSSQKINTYSIAVTDGKINEAPFAAKVAQHLQTNHHELPITQKEILDMVPGFIQVYDEPFSDSSAFPTMLVSKLARQHVTVTLSGDGGDELFWGYGSYLWTQRLQHPFFKAASPLISAAAQFGNSRYKRAGKMFESFPAGHFKSHVFSQDQHLFSEKDLSRLLVEPASGSDAFNGSYTGRALSAVEQMSFWDIENYLKDDLLVKVDRASMQYSLETRVPLLDYRLVEFALNLSPDLKISKDGTMKYLLKEVLYDHVPKALLERPKWGFSIPLVKWLKTELSWLIDTYCAKDVIEQAGIVHYKEVERLVKLYRGGKHDYLYNRIWALVVVHWFLHERQ